MIDHLAIHVLPAALSLLPLGMDTPSARAMLLAIALQESKCCERRQIRGPAKGFWQFEMGGGVRGVMTHPASRTYAQRALDALQYRDLSHSEIHDALEHNDTLACVFARLLLYTLPSDLPERGEAGEGWRQYIAAWRPGKPHREMWDAHFTTAWEVA